MSDQEKRSFEGVHERLAQIVDEVSAEDISLDDALRLYEEAVKLGLSACDLSEQDIDAYLGADGDAVADAPVEEPRAGVAAADGAPAVMAEREIPADLAADGPAAATTSA